MSKSFENKLRLFVYELLKRYGGQANAKFTMTALLGSFGLKVSVVRLEDMKKHGILLNYIRESGTANRGVHFLYTVNATVDEKAIEAFIQETDLRNKQNSKEYRQIKKKREQKKQRALARKKQSTAAVEPTAQQIRFSDAIAMFDPRVKTNLQYLLELNKRMLAAGESLDRLAAVRDWAQAQPEAKILARS